MTLDETLCYVLIRRRMTPMGVPVTVHILVHVLILVTVIIRRRKFMDALSSFQYGKRTIPESVP
jgi:hypothetical protein